MTNLDDLRIDSAIPRPHRRRPSPWPALVIFAVLAFGAWWLLRDRLDDLRLAVQPPPPPVEEPAETAPTRPAAPAGSFTAGGYLEVTPPGPAVASTLIDGRVVELRVKAGDTVSAGQIVARLDDSLLRQDVAVQQSEVELARASLTLAQSGFRHEEIDAAQADVASAQSRLRKAQSDLARYDRLYAEGVISATQHDSYRSAVEQADGDLAASQSRLALLEAGQRREEIGIHEQRVAAARSQLGRAQTLLGKTTITAPVDGVVLDTYVQPGGWVSTTDGGEHAGQVCSIFAPDNLQAYADVNQRDVARVHVGQRVSLTTDVAPDAPLSGTVTLLAPSADLQRNTVQVKIALDDQPDYLRPQMSVQVTFEPAGVASE